MALRCRSVQANLQPLHNGTHTLPSASGLDFSQGTNCATVSFVSMKMLVPHTLRATPTTPRTAATPSRATDTRAGVLSYVPEKKTIYDSANSYELIMIQDNTHDIPATAKNDHKMWQFTLIPVLEAK